MKKLNIRKTAIAMVLITIVIVEIIAFGLSRAQNVKEIILYATDQDGLLEKEETILKAFDGEESGYFISLPEIINEKVVTSYQITEKQIQENNSTTEKTVEVKPGSTLYLTEEELKNLSVTLNVIYDKYETEDKSTLLYNKSIQTEKITVSGYMPLNAVLSVEEKKSEDYQEQLKDKVYEGENTNVYSIKIFEEEESEVEYIASEFGQTLKIEFTQIDSTRDFGVYKLQDIPEENNVVNEEQNTNTLVEDENVDIENENENTEIETEVIDESETHENIIDEQTTNVVNEIEESNTTIEDEEKNTIVEENNTIVENEEIITETENEIAQFSEKNKKVAKVSDSVSKVSTSIENVRRRKYTRRNK